MQNILTHKRFYFVFGLILLVGILLRAYHFRELLVFNFDQARDAGIIRDVVEKSKPLPMLGPKAGSTKFKLGAAFYYFQFAVAKVFGSEPYKLAYFDFFFSILSIPLLFYFLRKYFTHNLALALTGLYSISYFAVRYARFAWNPNSLPFFSMLFLLALLEIINPQQKYKKIWLIVAGFVLGVGVQLHALFLFIMPVVLGLFVWRFGKKQSFTWKKGLLVVGIALLLNIPQLYAESKTHGRNTRDFIAGVELTFRKSKTTVVEDFWLNTKCQVQANSEIVSSFGNYATCDFSPLYFNQNALTKLITTGRIVFAILFSVAGYFLLWNFWQKEKDARKRELLWLLGVYAAVSFLVLVPFMDEISNRYFLIFVFVPFFLLGFIVEYLLANYKKGLAVATCLLFLLAGQNVFAMKRIFTPYATDLVMENETEREAEFLANFIMQHVDANQSVYVGEKFGDWRLMEYFLHTKNITLVHITKDVEMASGAPYFLIVPGTAMSQKNNFAEAALKSYRAGAQASFGRFTIIKLEK